VSGEFIEKVPGILLEEFSKREAMRQEGVVVAAVTERDGWFAVQIRFRTFGGQVPEIGSYPAIKQDEVADDKVREMVSEALRVIWEQYEGEAVKQ